MTYTLTGMDTLGTVQSEESAKDAGLFFSPIPGSDSSSALQLDIFGATRTITIKGTWSPEFTDYANRAAFIADLDALINGAQSSKTYHSDTSNQDYTVLVSNAQWTASEGDPNSIEYTITLQEGSL